MRFQKIITFLFLFIFISFSLYQSGCNFITHRTLSEGTIYDSTSEDPEPNYNVSLDFDYQDFTSYLFIGNRVENFTAYFNTFYKANEDFDDALTEYRTSAILNFSKRLDSLSQLPPVTGSVKEKLEKTIERASKIIQFHKNSKFLDKAVLLIGKSYYYLTDYFNAERKFNEFLSKLSSSTFADEALLFLGRTKMQLGKNEEGLSIFKNLVQNSSDNEIKSLASRALGVNAYNNGNLDESVKYFKISNDFSNNKEVKAEGQYILAKIITYYKPEIAAKEYIKVLDYTSDFDLIFFARLNYAKGLIYNKDFVSASEILLSLRKKYRDVSDYTQLVDLEIANNLYGQKNYIAAKEKYFEVIVRYPNSTASADAYYYLAKHEEEIQKDYLKALINYKKAVEENNISDYYKESLKKAATFERYFVLKENLEDSANKITIPTANMEVEKFRKIYNEEKGIQLKQEENKQGDEEKRKDDEGEQRGDGKGKPGGFKKIYYKLFLDTIENSEDPSLGPLDSSLVNPKHPSLGPLDSLVNPKNPTTTPGDSAPNLTNPKVNESLKRDKESGNDSLGAQNDDSLKGFGDTINVKNKDERVFDAYYELAELFLYNLERNDSAEYYLKLLLSKYTESDKQTKVLYTLGNFYKNINKKVESEETFRKIIANYPNTIYAYESKKILGLKTNETDIAQNPVNEIFKQALNLLNEKKFDDAILKLQEVKKKYPQDSLVAKSLYSIGWIYENSLANKDSSIAYYEILREEFPKSEYAYKVSPVLDYIASLGLDSLLDSTKNKSTPIDTTKEETHVQENEKSNEDEINEKIKEIKSDTTYINNENKLSPEEIEKLLREGDDSNK